MEAKYIVFFILINVQIIRAADTFNQPSKTSDYETIIKNPKELSDRLLDLKNWNQYCDAEIIVGNERIPVHKNVLASSSEYFVQVFPDNESYTEVELKNMDVEIVKSLIEYSYTGFISITEKNLREIMSAAIFLKIAPIVEGCEKILEKNINSSNSISIWKLARSGNRENLRDKALECVRQNNEKISQSLEFLDLDHLEVLELLKSDIAVTPETIVFNSVKNWINHDKASRIQYMDELSNYIKFEDLPKNILLSESHDLCSINPSYKCLIKILNALQQKEKNNDESADNNLKDSNSTLMAVGSFWKGGSKSFEIFNLTNEKWIRIENFKCYKTLYSSVLLEDKVMLVGGYNDDYNIAINTVQSYNLNTGEMENLPPLKYARYGLSAVEFKGRVYAIGGWDAEISFNYVEMWDPVLKIWKELSPMSIPRSSCGAGVLDDEIIVVGGFNGEYLTDIESYNPVTDRWRKRGSMNEKRSSAGVAVVGRYLYAVGGIGDNYDNSNTAERYDPQTDKWTMIHSLNKTRHGMGAANLFGKLVVVGGWIKEVGDLSTAEMYDDVNNTWISMSSLNQPRWRLNAIKIPWRLAVAILSREVSR